MSLFASGRERRLWMWTAAIMVAIYSSLGPAQVVAEALRERNLLRVTITLGLVLAGGIIAWRWLRRRPGEREIGVVISVTAVYLWALARGLTPEERTHLIEYAVVAGLIYSALVERRKHGRRVPAPAALALLTTLLLGWIDEGIQALLPNRVYDIRDVGFNAIAALMAIAASLGVEQARRRRRARRNSTAPFAPR